MDVSTNQFKNGMTIIIDNILYEIIEFQHVKPGKGGAFVRTKLRNVDAGKVIDKTFRAGEKFELAHLEHKKMQYLYDDGSNYVFMDNQTYEQTPLSHDTVGSAAKFIKEGMEIDMSFYKSNPISIKPPVAVEMLVTEAEPGFKGDTAQGGNKKVITETGLEVQAPLFIEKGNIIKVDSRTGEYLGKK
ncbi:MAG: elongation factor P [Actinobacteria bacterium]|nr:MAG: elongation factor P [Actinomycetota bacterium]